MPDGPFWGAYMLLAERLWPERWRGQLARKYLLAIGFQESAFSKRRQEPVGPARSFWQIEPATLLLLFEHKAVEDALKAIARELHIGDRFAIDGSELWAAACARALLWTDPFPLKDSEEEAWRIYLRTWRPGKPKPERWPLSWRWAEEALGE